MLPHLRAGERAENSVAMFPEELVAGTKVNYAFRSTKDSNFKGSIARGGILGSYIIRAIWDSH